MDLAHSMTRTASCSTRVILKMDIVRVMEGNMIVRGMSCYKGYLIWEGN